MGLEAVCQEFGRRESPTCADCCHSPPSASQPVAAGSCFARCTEAACQVPQGALPYTKVSTVAAGQACGIVPFRKAFGQLSVHKNLAVRSRGSTACVACWHSVPDMVGPCGTHILTQAFRQRRQKTQLCSLRVYQKSSRLLPPAKFPSPPLGSSLHVDIRPVERQEW